MNLLRRGTPAGVNDYGPVRPEIEFRNTYQGLQQQLNSRQNAATGSDTRAGLPTTGYTAMFLNTGAISCPRPRASVFGGRA
ncbi:MAG: hypothetical protein ACJ8F7_23080 [Gemmataceae bacterium]